MPALFRASQWRSPRSRPKTIFSLLLACSLALPFLTAAQSPLGPVSSEYLLKAFSGDQVAPRLALSPNGGWIVWSDNVNDGRSNGLGIAASRFDNTFAPLTNRIRINYNLAGDQIKPDVALLANGNAAFVWESGGPVTPGIYARFRSASGAFLTNDLKLTSTTFNITNKSVTNMYCWLSNRWVLRKITLYDIVTGSRRQSHDPAVAGLTDGSAVVVYSGTRKYTHIWDVLGTVISRVNNKPMTNDFGIWTTNKLDDMEEIFFQRYDNKGVRLSGEKLVNQFSAYNQRNPAVAALPNGNFVVVWVSEQQFPNPIQLWVLPGSESPPCVAICGRLYNGSGQPLSDEFRIDGIDPLICSHPAVAAAADGGFFVAWSQRALRTSTDRWDVYGRLFGPDAVPQAPAFRINSFTRGDQYMPQIASQGLDQLVLWTSYGQDGSMEGVYGRLLSEGVLAGDEFRVNTTTRNKQFHPAVALTTSNRFLAVWSGYNGLGSGFDLFAQKYGLFPALTGPAPPQVVATSVSTLNVNWPEVANPNLLNYLLYVDDSATALALTNTSWQATGLQPGSTHSFRLAYQLTDGERSRLSTRAYGTTLTDGQTPGGTQVVDATGSNGSTNTNTGGSISDPGLPRVTLTRNGVKLAVQWNSEPGISYQIQVSTNLAGWLNLGTPRTATAASTVQNCEVDTQAAFYRVVRIP